MSLFVSAFGVKKEGEKKNLQYIKYRLNTGFGRHLSANLYPVGVKRCVLWRLFFFLVPNRVMSFTCCLFFFFPPSFFPGAGPRLTLKIQKAAFFFSLFFFFFWWVFSKSFHPPSLLVLKQQLMHNATPLHLHPHPHPFSLSPSS